MRCKNCGSENDNNLYICQNCGSPLYDEDEPVNSGDTTQVFSAVGTGQALDNFNNAERNPRHVQRYDDYPQERPARNMPDGDDEKKKKQQIAIIVLLSLILLAIIAGTVVAIVHAKKGADATTVPSETLTEMTEDESTTAPTTETTTTTTTETTTETTTTTTTTKPKKVTITATYSDGGMVEGDGDYQVGDKVTLIARPDDGYEFEGWYSGGSKVGSDTKYRFTAKSNKKIKAVFKEIATSSESEETPGGEDTAD